MVAVADIQEVPKSVTAMDPVEEKSADACAMLAEGLPDALVGREEATIRPSNPSLASAGLLQLANPDICNEAAAAAKRMEKAAEEEEEAAAVSVSI